MDKINSYFVLPPVFSITDSAEKIFHFIWQTHLGDSQNRGGTPKWMVYNGRSLKQKFLMTQMGVEPNIGVKRPKWMVYFMENPIKMDEMGVPLFLETPILGSSTSG